MKKLILLVIVFFQIGKSTAQPGYNNAFGLSSPSTDNIGTQNTGGYSIARDAQGNVYITGGFLGTINFNPTGTANLTSAGNTDFFIAKYSSTGIYQWAFALGSTAADYTSKIIVDLKGNIYVAGISRAANATNIDFDPSSNTNNLTMLGGFTNFIVKYDGNKLPTDAGFYTWGFVAGTGYYLANNSSTMMTGNCIAIDKAGYLYVTGNISTTSDLDPSSGISNFSSPYNANMFVAKYNGNLLPSNTSFFQWAKVSTSDADGSGQVYGATAITVDVIGNVYVTGEFSAVNDGVSYFNSFVDFSGTNVSGAKFSTVLNGTSNYAVFHSYIVKYNSSGTYQWAFTLANPDYQEINDITSDASGNIYLTGTFGYYGGTPSSYTSTQDFDPSSNTNNLTDAGYGAAFVAKYNGALLPTNTAFYQWAFKVAGSTTVYSFRGLGITLDPVGNIYVAGQFANTNIDFDPGLATNNLSASGAQDGFIASYTNSGNYRWAYSLGGTGKDAAKSVILDVSGNILITGYYNSAGFNPGFSGSNLTGTGAHNIFIESLYLTDNVYYKWSGTSSNAFATGSNWINTAVPSASNVAVIPTAANNNPVQVSSATSLTDLTVQSSASINIASANTTASNYIYNVGGTISVSSTYTIQANAGVYNSGIINGAGTIISDVLNISTGTIAPGSTTAIGKLSQTGNFTSHSGGVINIKVAGTGIAGAINGYDQFAIVGNAILGGTLNISSLNGFNLYTGVNASIITASTITGTFTTVNWPAGITTGTITYNATSVIITVPPLPLKLLSFTAIKKESNVILNWITENEINTSYTYIEFSKDGKEWVVIGKVNNNNSSGKNNYQFNHSLTTNYLQLAAIFYRLQQVDKDGKYNYSEIRTIKQETSHELTIYPNPVTNGKLNIDMGEEVKTKTNYAIVTINGKILRQGYINNRQETITIIGLPSGNYVLKIGNKQELFVVEK